MSLWPPSIVVAFGCGLAALSLVALQLRAGRQPDRAPGHRGIVIAASAVWLMGVALGALALRLPSLPYNVRELAGDSSVIALPGLATMLLACGLVPAAFALFWKRRAEAFGILFIPGAIALASLLFLAAWMTFPLESLDDVVGFPVLGIGGTTERWLRFVGLLLGPLAGLTLGVRLPLGGFRSRSFLVGLGAILVAGGVSYVVVVPMAGTSNIVELLRGRGDLLAVVGLAGYVVWLGAIAGALALIWVARRRSLFPDGAATLLIVLLSVPPAWQALVVATNPQLEKYGEVFAARQFLLSADREHLLDDTALWLRFAALQGVLTLVLAGGAAAVLISRRDPFD